MYNAEHYLDSSGFDPFDAWLRSLRDTIAKVRVAKRLDRLTLGNFGDCKPVGEGVWELRIDHGPGYRVYYARAGKNIVLLLMGGDKSSQQHDITKAHSYWLDWQNR